MTSKTITDRAGDTLRLSTGSLTAGPGEITIKITERFRGREAVAAVHVDPAALRAALDGVAPLGKYTRTTLDPDDMDGGVTAALIEKEVERPDAEVRDLRSALARELARGNALQDALDAAESRPLTPTDEMVERGRSAYWGPTYGGSVVGRVRAILTAALTEPPARPEGAERWEDFLIDSLDYQALTDQQITDLADRIAEEMNR